MSEEEKSSLDHLVNHAEEYVKTQLKLTKLVTVETTASAVSSVFASMTLFLLFILAVVFASIAGALALSEYMGSAYEGFLGVALFYLLVAVVLYVKKESWLRRPIMNTVVKSIFKDQAYEQD